MAQYIYIYIELEQPRFQLVCQNLEIGFSLSRARCIQKLQCQFCQCQMLYTIIDMAAQAIMVMGMG